MEKVKKKINNADDDDNFGNKVADPEKEKLF